MFRGGEKLPSDHTGAGSKIKACHTGKGGVSAIPPKRENFYIISYDISVNRVRTKIANELKNYGRRVQYSVFECELTEKKFWELYGKLSKLLQMTDTSKTDDQEAWKDSSNSIRIYRLCGACMEQIRLIGAEQTKKEDSDIIII